MFTPAAPSAGPTGGAGVAWPAWIWRLMTLAIFFLGAIALPHCGVVRAELITRSSHCGAHTRSWREPARGTTVAARRGDHDRDPGAGWPAWIWSLMTLAIFFVGAIALPHCGVVRAELITRSSHCGAHTRSWREQARVTTLPARRGDVDRNPG